MFVCAQTCIGPQVGLSGSGTRRLVQLDNLSPAEETRHPSQHTVAVFSLAPYPKLVGWPREDGSLCSGESAGQTPRESGGPLSPKPPTRRIAFLAGLKLAKSWARCRHAYRALQGAPRQEPESAMHMASLATSTFPTHTHIGRMQYGCALRMRMLVAELGLMHLSAIAWRVGCSLALLWGRVCHACCGRGGSCGQCGRDRLERCCLQPQTAQLERACGAQACTGLHALRAGWRMLARGVEPAGSPFGPRPKKGGAKTKQKVGEYARVHEVSGQEEKKLAAHPNASTSFPIG